MAANTSSSQQIAPEAPTLYSLQILRGLAAVLVLAYHYAPYLRETVPGHDLGFTLFSEGYVGVDIFFLISGFIIVHSTAQPRHATPAAFVLRRFFRVVPAAQAATLIYAVILPNWPSLAHVVRSLLFLPQADIDPPVFGFPVVHQEWTLAYELLFYGVFAVALILSHRHRILIASVLLVALIVGGQALLGGPFALRPEAIYLPPQSAYPLVNAALGESGNPILVEFIAGMLLAAAYRKHGSAARSGPAGLWAKGLAALLLLVFVASFCSGRYPGHGLLNRGAGALALVAGALLLELASGPPSAALARRGWFRAALGLGTLSYSLYLVHLGIAERTLRFLALHAFGKDVAGLAGFLALLPTALLLAWMLHVWVEQPCMRLGRRLAQAASAPSAARSA